jgi:hypothetical protein
MSRQQPLDLTTDFRLTATNLVEPRRAFRLIYLQGLQKNVFDCG